MGGCPGGGSKAGVYVKHGQVEDTEKNWVWTVALCLFALGINKGGIAVSSLSCRRVFRTAEEE
jgi:hypothetical protein